MKKPYIVVRDPMSGAWYCCKRGYDYVPVFGSVGSRAKAEKVCKTMNASVGR